MTIPVYAVTGASGHVGRYAVHQLLACGVPASDVVAVVHTRGKARGLAAVGVQVRAADYSRPETLGAVLAGADRLLLVSSSQVGQLAAQHTNVIAAAKAAGVSRILYTSMLNADDSTSPLAGEHRDTERVLSEAGVPFTVLRSQDLAHLLRHPATSLAEVVRAGYDLLKVRSTTATIGLIEAGMIGGTIARLAVDAGYHVVLSNSRGPQTLRDLAEGLGPHARTATPAEAAAAGDIVVVAVPLKAYRQVPAEPLAGKVVIDTTNHLPELDGHIAELDGHIAELDGHIAELDDQSTTTQLLQARLPASHVIKAFNTMYFEHLATLARPREATDRSAVPFVGDDQTAKTTVTAFLDAIGYDA